MDLNADSAKPGNSKVPTLASVLAALARFESPSVEDVVYALAQQYSDPLYSYCMAALGNPEESEQVVTSVLYEAGLEYQKTHEVPAPEWMYGRTRARYIDVLRKRKSEDNTIPIDYLPSEIIGHKWQPEEEAIAHELDRSVTQIIMSLEYNMRLVFILWYQGFSGKEIAERLGISEVNVRQLRFRAARIISRTLGRSEVDDEG